MEDVYGQQLGNKDKGVKEELKEIKEMLDDVDSKKSKRKKFKMPRKGKVSKRKIKQGYVTVIALHENKNLEFNKKQIKGSTIDLDDTTWHGVESEDIFFYKGKPVILQPKNLKNPYNPFREKGNETYGQKHIKARMISDMIKMKKKMGNIILWLVIGIVAVYILTQGI